LALELVSFLYSIQYHKRRLFGRPFSCSLWVMNEAGNLIDAIVKALEVRANRAEFGREYAEALHQVEHVFERAVNNVVDEYMREQQRKGTGPFRDAVRSAIDPLRPRASVVTSKPAINGHFKTGH
jgi:hypothetical protein